MRVLSLTGHVITYLGSFSQPRGWRMNERKISLGRPKRIESSNRSVVAALSKVDSYYEGKVNSSARMVREKVTSGRVPTVLTLLSSSQGTKCSAFTDTTFD